MDVLWLEITDEPQLWRSLGFTVSDDGVCVVGDVEHRLIGPLPDRRGIVRWGVSGVDDTITDIDGIETVVESASPERPPAATHPNGADCIDHLVVLSSSTPRTATAFEGVGLERRGHITQNHAGDAVDMTFFWAGDTLIELAGPPEPSPDEELARLRGIAYTSGDIDASKEFLGDQLTTPKDAVQKGRKIAAIRREVGSTVPIAFMSPHVRSEDV
ncbi:MAG: glyoxalase [Acidimicrobiales bacterium]|nr:MAG: glyoxalase [Acidimicrobiales bacterium]